jgi:AbiJ N-terminal domain 4
LKVLDKMNFSERYGHTPVRSVLQTDNIDDALRNKLWNVISSTLFVPDEYTVAAHNDYLPRYSPIYGRFINLWHNYFKMATDTIGSSYEAALRKLRGYFFKTEWHSVYDVTEFLANSPLSATIKEGFIVRVNAVLKEEMAAYRFVSGRIVQITSEEEIASIEQALALPDPLKVVTAHLQQALVLLANKKSPDYRNSIKESISAIESLSKILSGLPTATLTPALNAVDKQTKLHPSLKEAFQKLYGYTSDAQGIRHALMEQPTLDFEDAKFMLVSCSAFANYMVVKAQKAGITV